MGKGRPRAVQKRILGQSSTVSSCSELNIPSGPVFYPTEEEFKDPLEYIYKIRPEAEPFGICRVVPPKSWNPPFALDLDSFTFPTKTQDIHKLQVRPAACDPKTFDLEYSRFLENHCCRKTKKKVVFEAEELDLCKFYNAVKRYGGYDKVVEEKKWGEVFRFVRPIGKISECSKHVLCQLYREHLYDYENYSNWLNHDRDKNRWGGVHPDIKHEEEVGFQMSKRKRRNADHEKVKVCKVEKEEEEELDQICEQCRSGLHGEVMLLCDRCNRGWHIYCLSPPLKKIPQGNWYCFECLNSDKDSFGFVPGKQFSLETFRRMADRAKRKWFGSSPIVSRLQIERKFWEIVEGSVGEVKVMYGSDLDTSAYGSGFPRSSDKKPQSVEDEVWSEYCFSPWNLNNLPKLEGSMLQAVHQSIAGVMVPWLYVGMLFSSFCWHFEDHCFYSMNYLHWGEPKCWYSVPGSEACSFEKVMRNSLPDLFDAQPDLLFQLVTMLNPSVLQENGVPVYSVLQEPGNFVITFPRSFHGGFNFGLNCAEAVNFAPADWLPHGGVAAGLYQLYHKAAVLSHEELLCVVAKNFDRRTSPYLKKELLRVYGKEKIWREKLWRNGVVNSRAMSSRKHPEYVGTEEDPMCMICQQYLYLSAVVCCCSPSAFVCLEHWKHLCECNTSKRCLLYRYTLAELNDIVLMGDKSDSGNIPQNKNSQRQLSCSNGSIALTKKVKRGHVSLRQLSEEWVSGSVKLLERPFASGAYTNALKEVEQFLWAGSEMDPVRNLTKKLIEAQSWAEGIRDCLAKIEKCSSRCDHDIEKVHSECVNKLLCFDPAPCNEPRHHKLKEYKEDAQVLIREIESVLSTSSEVSISELEKLYSRARDFPIYIKEIEILVQKISSAKVWMDNVRKCTSETRPAAIEIDFLQKLKLEMLELQLLFPEKELLLDLLRQAESCAAKCKQILKSPISLKKLEMLLQELDSFVVDIPELKLLKQYRSDAVLWISRFNDVLVNIHEREDQENVVEELNCILKDGSSLSIQVDEMSLVEIELNKACCRKKALEARAIKMDLDFIHQLIVEAVELQIDNETLFVDMSKVLEAAICWEERAAHILSTKATMPEFEDVIRSSEDIFAILPSLNSVKDAVLIAKSWLINSKPFLKYVSSAVPDSSFSLTIEALKDLVLQSKLLKISLGERAMLETVLEKCEEWKNDAYSFLEVAEGIFNMNDICNRITTDITSRIEQLFTPIEFIIAAGIALRVNFFEIPKLQNACSRLRWCFKALSFCSIAPSLEEVERLMKEKDQLSITYPSGSFWCSLVDGVKWVKKALELTIVPFNQRCNLSDAEEVLEESKRLKVSFPVMVDRLANAIEKNKLWQDQVQSYFGLNSDERAWTLLLHLKEQGLANPFGCPELDMVSFEVEKVERWKSRCKDIGDLSKIKHSLDISLYIYNKSKGSRTRNLCIWCATDFEDEEFLTCSICKYCYHFQCAKELADINDANSYICSYCQVLKSGSISLNGCAPLKFVAERAELKILIDLLSDSKSFSVCIEEREILRGLVEQALKCKAYLTEIVEFALTYRAEDFSIITDKLVVALKAVEVAGLNDDHGNRNFELALARNSWRVRVHKTLESSQKPLIQQIESFLEEGLAITMPPDDHFRRKLEEMKSIGMLWADNAKKVAADSGELGLQEVYNLIEEGENLPVHFEKELKLLKDRSMLYCICRKPYDHRAMIACDQCDEWYHFDCIKLGSPPEIYICPACSPHKEGSTETLSVTRERVIGTNYREPKTPSPRPTKLRRKPKKSKSISARKNVDVVSSGISLLFWSNRKPFRRAARRRTKLETLSSFFHLQRPM